MNSPSDQHLQPPRSPGKPLSEKTSLSNSSHHSGDNTESITNAARQGPIPPPNHSKQYRAIGLIEGKYQPSQEKITIGKLIASDGRERDAVLLGRIISLIKNHIDLSKNHLWVVYPRSLQENDSLHLQIVGIWEPETLKQDNLPSKPAMVAEEETDYRIESGYFSIRGEVVFASEETETAIVKIKQSPKKESDKTKFFKLKLKGTLSEKPVNHFWDLQVQLQGDTLVIQEATDLGWLIKKKSFPEKQTNKYPRQNNRRQQSSDHRSNLLRKSSEKPSLNRPSLRQSKKNSKPNQNN